MRTAGSFTLLLSGYVLSATAALGATPIWFAPANDFARFDNIMEDANLTEADFTRITDEVIAIYKPIAEAHNATIVSVNEWDDPTVNAFATQTELGWEVHMFGGLARRPEATQDGFALVVCHELGHHFAGYPFYDATNWAANEGQSDYFATLSCAHRLWGDRKTENAALRMYAPLNVRQACNAVVDDHDAQNLCYRSIRAGQSLANLLATLGGSDEPRLETVDLKEVAETNPAHPEAQCRFDTYVAGALCGATFDSAVIPARSQPEGQDSVNAEAVSNAYACTRTNGEAVGQRPRCWFAPKMRLSLDSTALVFSEIAGNGNAYIEPGEAFEIAAPLVNTYPTQIGGATATLAALTSLTVDTNMADYGVLAPNATSAPDAGFIVTVPATTACGSKIDAPVIIRSPAGRDQGALSLTIGRLEDLAALDGPGGSVAIPDADPVGIEQSVDVLATDVVVEAAVAVKITHTYAGDLGLRLISPAGVSTWLKIPGVGDVGSLDETFHVNLANVVATGTWKLVVADWFDADEGTLESWSLTLKKGVCEAL